MSVIDVTASAEFKKLTSEHPAIVDFSATWCGPCRRVEPVFKELAKANKNIKFIHIDIDEASETMPNELQDISSVPTFKVLYQGKVIETFAGADLSKLRASVDKLKAAILKDSSKDDAESKKSEEPAKKADDSKAEEASKPEEAAKKAETDKPNEVQHVSTKEEFTEFLSKGKSVVDYSATWCGPCKKIAPIYEKTALENPGIKFLKVDIDEMGDELTDIIQGIRGVPTFQFYNEGDLVSEFAGANPANLAAKVKELVDLKASPKSSDSKEAGSKKNEEDSETKSSDQAPKVDEKKEEAVAEAAKNEVEAKSNAEPASEASQPEPDTSKGESVPENEKKEETIADEPAKDEKSEDAK